MGASELRAEDLRSGLAPFPHSAMALDTEYAVSATNSFASLCKRLSNVSLLDRLLHRELHNPLRLLNGVPQRV